MADPQGFKVPLRPENIISKAQMRREVVRSDFQKTLDFPNRPIRPNPQVFDCWPNCEEDTFYFRRDPNEEFKCIDKDGKRIGEKGSSALLVVSVFSYCLLASDDGDKGSVEVGGQLSQWIS